MEENMEEKEKAAIARAYENLFDQYAQALGRFDEGMHQAITTREGKPKPSRLWFSIAVGAVIFFQAAAVIVLIRILLILKGL